MKRCTKCGLSVDEGAMFHKCEARKDGLNCNCKKCRSEHAKQYYCSEKGEEVRKRYLRSEKYKEYLKKYRQSAKYKETRKKYRQSENGKEVENEYSQSEEGRKSKKRHRQSEKYKEKRKKYYQSEKYKETQKKYIQTEQYKEAVKKHRKSAKYKETKKKRYAKNKISNCLSGSIRHSLRGNKNGHHWEDIVGWTLQQFKNRFNQLLKPGMTWENHGTVWEIDHIIPLSVHNITSIDCADFKRAWQLSNLQPLFKRDNRSKRNKLENHFQPTLF